MHEPVLAYYSLSARRASPAITLGTACRTLAKLDMHGLSGESIATLRFLVQAQALFMASTHDEAASARWAAFAGLSGAAHSRSKDSSDLFRRLSTATLSAQLPQLAGATVGRSRQYLFCNSLAFYFGGLRLKQPACCCCTLHNYQDNFLSQSCRIKAFLT